MSLPANEEGVREDKVRFNALTDARRLLRNFCQLHIPSLLELQSGISFKRELTEPELSTDAVENMTTSATCWTSLFDCPAQFWINRKDVEKYSALRDSFAEKSLLRPDERWKSEQSAAIYCRCRALPMIVAASKKNEKLDARIEGHLKTILKQLADKPARFAIGEADPELDEDKWYPPNAFHTYWTLEILRLVKNKFGPEYDELSKPQALDLENRSKGMLLWARQKLGHQLALHSASPQSSLLDSDQLAWSLAIFLRFDETHDVNLENRDFIKQAFKCLFSTQVDGTWRHYKPLFHYAGVGNAYCYVFETFAVLLQCALEDRAEAAMVRELLQPFATNLMDLWRHADVTKIPLKKGKNEVGWCSGHRTNFTGPESWATASVFQYAQSLRRLIGVWCREEALSGLNTVESTYTKEQAAEAISLRGESWGKRNSVSEQLWTGFINPLLMKNSTQSLEPDTQCIEANHARSAILFGPPGASKTTLVRRFADVIGWKYVEIHASHFVAEGLGLVQKTADEIFRKISELDHAVVLFDEIDELVRERDMERDAFGRFLTTSMLPKLAELWESRKILYFVATNHINYFDSAIIRSHRFDALILFSPPSYRSKVDRIVQLLSDTYNAKRVEFAVDESSIQECLKQIGQQLEKLQQDPASPVGNETQEMRIERWRERELGKENLLAKFALLRYDELNELAYRLSLDLPKSESPGKITRATLEAALGEIGDREWRKNKSYADYLRDTRSERRDFQMSNVWKIIEPTKIDGLTSSDGHWIERAVATVESIQCPPGISLITKPKGQVEIRQRDA